MMSASSPTDTDSNTRLVVTTPTSVAESVTTPPPQTAPTATKSRVKFLVEKANENELLLGPTKSERGSNSNMNLEAKVGQEHTVVNVENAAAIQNDDVTLPLKQNANFELYDDYQQKPLSSFLSSILNFNSLIPATKEIQDENNGGKKPKAVKNAKLGTVLGVFLPCVQNIFGVILFIRASWIVGTAGFIQAALIILMCCSCTFLTALSTSAIATNGIVPAGGPYFMISRSLGPEFGGAVGILFYLGNTVAASMYIVGAVEIFLKYIFPQATLIGDIDVQADAFHNFRIYGTLFLIIIGLCVFIGIKFVSKLAPISLIAVLLSVVCIYAGVIKSAFSPPDVQICVFNQSRLIRYEAFMINGQNYCTNKRECLDATTNKTFECPLWSAYCGPLFRGAAAAAARSNATTTPAISMISSMSQADLRQIDLEKLDDPVKQSFIHLCNYFQHDDSMQLRMGIPGVSNIRPISENYKENYRGEGEIYAGELGLPDIEVLGKEITSFLILVGIYFPSVTGIMAGSNRSGDLKDPSRSIPKGTITAVLCTSFVYLSSSFLFGSTVDGLLLRDKFGESVDKKLVVSLLAWPSKWIVMVGAFLSTFGAGLQSLTSAPRLLQALAKDDLIPFLRPLTVSYRGEPFRALLVTVFLCWCGILLGNVDYLTPLIAMFFLMCYGFVNLACALQTLLKAPSWRPRYKYYHWSLSLVGLLLCLFIMFIVKWYYAIVAILLAVIIYKYIEYKGAEKEWGDGLRGLSMSAARFALLKLEQAPPHVKNWRPQILIFVKCINQDPVAGSSRKESESQLDSNPKKAQTLAPPGLSSPPQPLVAELNEADSNGENQFSDFRIDIEHPNVFAFAAQLKSGRGLIVSANVISGDFIQNAKLAKACKYYIGKTMEAYRAKGFCDTLVCENVEQGLCNLIQTEGMGGLRHNTIVLNWPNKWNKEFFTKPNQPDEDDDNSLSLSSFVQTLRNISADDSAMIITKGIDSWPVNSKTDVQTGTIDLWWIIHDGGLLLLIVFLLKKHKIWQKCKLRLFTVAKENEHSLQIKNDLVQYMYYLRIDAEVDVIEMNDSEISAYTYQKTLKLHEREKLIREMRIKERMAENEPQIVIERSRRSSMLKQLPGAVASGGEQSSPSKNSSGAQLAATGTTSANEIEMNSISNQFTFSAAKDPRRPSIFQTDTIRKMHSAVELNKKIVEKSRDASLVLLNIPTPPSRSTGDYNYMSYINAATEGLNRVLLVRGSGREVITIFS